MTLPLFQNLNKRVLHNLIPTSVKLELPFITPLKDLLAHQTEVPLNCSCCGWKGSQQKAYKQYLVVEDIVELELFCTRCNHYLGFISVPKE